MTTYNTGNPLGSTDPRDLYDNAENLDELVNSDSKQSHPDRLGVQRKTWHGMEEDFQSFLQSSGYQYLGDYAPGIEITARNQVIRADGELWRLSASEDLTYTTTGAGMPEGGSFVSVGDAVLRQELAAPLGASKIGYVGRTQAQRNKDLPSVYDYDGATFQQRLESALSHGGKLVIPEGDYDIEAFNIATPKPVEILAFGATFRPLNTGKIFHFQGGEGAVIRGATFDLTAQPVVGADYAIYFDEVEYAHLDGVRFYGGNHGAFVNNAGRVIFEKCFGNAARRWHFYVQDCESTHMLYNSVHNGAYDGLKMGGRMSEDPEVFTKDVVIVGNVTSGNARDGIDLALNSGSGFYLSGNISKNDQMQGIDFKTVYQSTLGVSDAIICNNIAIKDGLTSDSNGINIQSSASLDSIRNLKCFGNVARKVASTTSNSDYAIRVANVTNAEIYENRSSGFYNGLRVIGNSENIDVHNNNFSDCFYGVRLSQTTYASPPKNIRIYKNTIESLFHSGAVNTEGTCVWIEEGADNTVYENEFRTGNARFSVRAENTGTSATNTRIGKNYRGWSKGIPLGFRAVAGEAWRNPENGIGLPVEWVCAEQTSSTNTANIFGIGQTGHRSGASSPVGVVAPNFTGERYFQTSPPQWWQAYSTGAEHWA